jgi:hypothetical protein
MEYYREVYKHSNRWNGVESLKDKTVIIYCEQGYGDIIQFARYFKEIKDLSATVYLHCPQGLHKLFAKCLNSKFKLIDRDNHKIPNHDFHVLSLSLPFLLNNKQESCPYLNVPEKAFLDHLEDYTKIGIAWEGNPDHSNNNERSCHLFHFRSFYQIPNVKLFMLQKGLHRGDFSDKCGDMELYATELNDFYDTAKLVNAMDVIVTVDTSVVHLAGAMGKKTFCLLSHKCDARWDLTNQTWYPNVTLLKQPFPSDWEGLFMDATMNVSYYLSRLQTS